MDKKRTQRILGILVIIALVIILFPLLFGKNDSPTQATNVPPPAFPQEQTPANTDPVAAASNTAPPSSPAEPQEIADSTESEDVAPSRLPSESAQANVSDIAAPSNTESETLEEESPPVSSKNISSQNNESNTPERPIHVQENTNQAVIPVVSQKIKSTALPPSKHSASKPSSPTASLENFHGQAWAIQMGSFKNKENARSLADRLRASGFKAFIKEIKTAHGHVQTRVYIGPEFKQSAAIALSKNIAKTTHLQGIIVSYQPLAL